MMEAAAMQEQSKHNHEHALAARPHINNVLVSCHTRPASCWVLLELCHRMYVSLLGGSRYSLAVAMKEHMFVSISNS